MFVPAPILGLALLGSWFLVSWVLVSWFLMRTLWLPRIGCWLLYLFSLAGLFMILILGLAFVAASFAMKNSAKAPEREIPSYVIGGAAIVLMFVGRALLKTWNKKPFAATMKWFLRFSFEGRVGKIRPAVPTTDPRYLAYRAVHDDAYGGDVRYGTVDGWGVKACCKRLIRIKHNR